MTSTDDLYQAFSESPFKTPFWDFYKEFWEAEKKFNLIFRTEHRTAIWAVNRVAFYYKIAKQLGLYQDETRRPDAPNTPTPDRSIDLEPVDLYVQTGALGSATAYRARPFGCVYTQHFVSRQIKQGTRILLVHDAPETLETHEGLLAITKNELWDQARQASGNAPPPKLVLDDNARAYWTEVEEHFKAKLGVTLCDPDTIQEYLRTYSQQIRWHTAFLQKIRPNAMICMTHDFRGAQIEAAKSLGIRTIDYQHGLMSKYHLGYGYPNVRPEHRKIQGCPDEVWIWGKSWISPDWFPEASATPRCTGHPEANQVDDTPSPSLESRPERAILILTSWAMKTSYRTVTEALAERHPDWRIILKLHPRESVESYADLAERHTNVTVVPGDTNVLDVAGTVRYVVSICSSALFEVMLRDCQIAVLRAPAIEYAEEFVAAHDVPVLELDASNFLAVIEVMKKQNLSKASVFYRPTPMDEQLLDESLSIPRERIWRAPLEPIRLSKPGIRTELQHFRDLFRWPKPTPRPQPSKQDDKNPRAGQAETGTTGKIAAVPATPISIREARQLYLNLRAWLDESPPPRQAARQIVTAIQEGLSPAYMPRAIRDTLADLEGRSFATRLSRQLMAAIFADTHIDADLLRAELYERHVKLFPEAHAREKRHWHAAAECLGALSPNLKILADRYRSTAATARAEFGDTRVDKADQQRLRDELKRRVRDPEPFSMLRVGDGEVAAFSPDYIPRDTLEAALVARQQLWWARPAEPKTWKRIQEATVDAFLGADYLGIPSIFRLLRDLPRLLPKMRGPIADWPTTASAHRILSEELTRLQRTGQLDWSRKTLLDDRCHQELFTPAGVLDFKVNDRPCVLVNCFTIDQVNGALGTRMFTDGIRLPPHTKVRDHVPDDAISRATMPEILDDLLDQVERQARKGALLFVAGGFAGKLLIEHARRHGGSALDVGATADYWMGLQTRGPLDFMQFREMGKRKNYIKSK